MGTLVQGSIHRYRPTKHIRVRTVSQGEALMNFNEFGSPTAMSTENQSGLRAQTCGTEVPRQVVKKSEGNVEAFK